MELFVGIITGCGFLGLIGIILKWLVSSMGKHVDRMAKHVDNINESFTTQSKLLINSMNGVRDEVESVREALENHVENEQNTHENIMTRLDAGDETNNLLLARVTSIEDRLVKLNGYNSH